jgi:hypothetical protein
VRWVRWVDAGAAVWGGVGGCGVVCDRRTSTSTLDDAEVKAVDDVVLKKKKKTRRGGSGDKIGASKVDPSRL